MTDTQRSLTAKIIITLVLTLGAVAAWWQMGIPLGLDLKGGTELLYRIRYEDIPESQRQDLTRDTVDIIRRRIDPQGILEPVITQRGAYRFSVMLPGLRPGDAKRIEERMQKAGKLMFCMVNDEPESVARAAEGRIVKNHEPYVKSLVESTPGKPPRPGKAEDRYVKTTFRKLKEMNDKAVKEGKRLDWLLVTTDPVVTGEYLDTHKIYPTNDQTGRPAVAFEFKGAGRARFTRVTERSQGKRLAIVLDDVLYSAPVIKERIGRSGIISGEFSQAEQADLIVILKAGSLPAGIELEWKHSVGPELGRDSIESGARAAIIGTAAVILFMGIYYLASGMVANFGVCLTMVLILGCMALFRATLTMPGIAGLLLTVGMAVDANVLIYERIREETERGKSPRLALKAGFERAFPVIFDSNLTTLLTALILYAIGVGPIRGFAVTLSIGLIASMFAALFVCRFAFELLLSAGWIEKFHMLQFFHRPNIGFCKVRYLCIFGSLVLTIGGMTLFFLRGEKKYDNDFTGGYIAEMALGKALPVEDFRARVYKSGYDDANIQTLGGAAERGQDIATNFAIRVKRPDVGRQTAKLQRDLAAAFSAGDLLAKIEPAGKDQPWTFRLALPRAISAPEARRLLDQAGYRDAAISALIFPDMKAREYELRLAGRVEGHDVIKKEMDTAVNDIQT